jgi:hypothetical protein
VHDNSEARDATFFGYLQHMTIRLDIIEEARGKLQSASQLQLGSGAQTNIEVMNKLLAATASAVISATIESLVEM